jgi:hypothetical protein
MIPYLSLFCFTLLVLVGFISSPPQTCFVVVIIAVVGEEAPADPKATTRSLEIGARGN